jgi:hypothetical protein
MKRSICILLFILFIAQSVAGDLDIGMTIPLESQNIYQPDRLVAGVTWHDRAKVILNNTGDTPVQDVVVTVFVPLGMNVTLPDQEITDIRVEGDRVIARIEEIKPGTSSAFFFAVKPPESIEFKKTASFSISASYKDSAGVHSKEYAHDIEIIPPPSWITYGTILASILILFIVFTIARKFNVLEWFTTIDLITIALLAALIGIVFRWFWQTFNDLLGPLGGLLFTIPTAVLLITALQLVRKPGTATLLFTIIELISMVVWGTNITVWLGWYMSEGLIVDALVLLFKKDYGDRRSTAIIYGFARSAFSYWTFYFLFAPAIWKVYYAPWYAWTEVGIACIGGIIGGAIGYDIAKKMRGAVL